MVGQQRQQTGGTVDERELTALAAKLAATAGADGGVPLVHGRLIRRVFFEVRDRRITRNS